MGCLTAPSGGSIGQAINWPSVTEIRVVTHYPLDPSWGVKRPQRHVVSSCSTCCAASVPRFGARGTRHSVHVCRALGATLASSCALAHPLLRSPRGTATTRFVARASRAAALRRATTRELKTDKSSFAEINNCLAARRHEAPRGPGCALGWRPGRNGSGISSLAAAGRGWAGPGALAALDGFGQGHARVGWLPS